MLYSAFGCRTTPLAGDGAAAVADASVPIAAMVATMAKGTRKRIRKHLFGGVAIALP